MNEYKFNVVINNNDKICRIKAKTFEAAYKQLQNRNNVQLYRSAILPDGTLIYPEEFKKYFKMKNIQEV